MTVITLKNLIESLADYPDDAKLCVVFSEHGMSAINIDLRIISKDGTVLNKSIGLED